MTHADVQVWVSGLDLAPASVVKVHRVASQVFAHALRDGRIGHNLCEGGDAAAGRAGTKAVPHPPAGRPDGRPAHRQPGPTVGRLTVAEFVTPTGKGLVWGSTKNHEHRRVPLPPFPIDDIDDFAELVDGDGPGNLVFTAPMGGIMRSQQFQRTALNAAAEQMGLATPTEIGDVDDDGNPVIVWSDNFHPHEFRHTVASLAIASGADVKVIQTMLGHKSAAMTLDQYGHLFGDRLDLVARAMDDARTAALTRGADRGSAGAVEAAGGTGCAPGRRKRP